MLGAAFREITKREAMPWKSVLTLLTSGIFAACSYGVWMGGVNADLNDLVKSECALRSQRRDCPLSHTTPDALCNRGVLPVINSVLEHDGLLKRRASLGVDPCSRVPLHQGDSAGI